ncbi:HupE/UreJ family protein [Azoarcus sp. L1K30]|uniref:HupE/UreJ family protein n=1 Tax=Azoarcus sp. L1K30 TaxID=2820277 RepID=UPI001B82DE04|nr:HupE/UreJ family protein [Azoarcus sp. L1K30]MBR0566858.1 HupE/UreJ family protein [Azoarcus sp. L1K30]
MTPHASRASLIAALTVAASPAEAHLVQTGFGVFYDGVAHLAVTPSDLLIILALGLLAGQRGPRAARLAVIALPLAWLAGGLIGARWTTDVDFTWMTTLPFLIIGALVALDAKIQAHAVLLIATVAGMVHGLVNGASMAPAGAGTLAIVGAVCGVACLSTALTAEITALPAGWPRIAVRAAGSWITATGMLMFGWLLHTAS